MAQAEPAPGLARHAALWLVLAGVASLWAFRAALGFDFIAIDDLGNITLNPHMGPPGAWNLGWMFTDADYVRRYIPLGWLGFSAVFAAGGLSPAAYHAANLLVHMANTALLFGIVLAALRRWGPGRGADWDVTCAGIAACLWALHPFRAETIGWISGLLYGQAGLFALLSVAAYLRAGAEPAGSGRRWAWLAAAALGYLASLLTYPIAIGLVAVFFVIDAADRRPFRLLAEKWLLVLPAVLTAAVTVAARFRANTRWPPAPGLAEFPALDRAMQGFYVFAYYIWKTLLPFRLTPAPTQLYQFSPLGTAFVASAAAVMGLTAALLLRRSWRCALLLWIGYLALLVPIAGFTEHPHYPNDRYSYLPGMVMAAALALALARLKGPSLRAGAFGVAALAATLSARSAARQLPIWRDSDTVFIAILSNTNNPVVRIQNFSRWAIANANLGRYVVARSILAERGREYPPEVFAAFPRPESEAYRADISFDTANPVFGSANPPEALGNLKIAIEAAKSNRPRVAEAHFRRAIAIAPGFRDAVYNYALFLAHYSRPAESLHAYFIMDCAAGPGGFTGEGRLLSVLAQAYWDRGEAALARAAVARGLARTGGSDASAAERLRSQQAEYAQALPALRDSTIR